MSPYTYSTSNSVLKEQLKLLGESSHSEGGYFVETDRRQEEIPSPYANEALRSLATSIYYLLDPQSSRGRLHLNKSTTYQLHHAGRALYTLLRPSDKKGEKPLIKQVVMGDSIELGEVRQLIVGGGWWKASELPEEDLAGHEDGERIGCLISEVVVPGFDWHDHTFLTQKGLLELFEGDEEDEWFKKLSGYVKNQMKE
ncbi:hypothetical protein JCM5353_001059 [Sporobolomyces roseus]